MSGATPNSATLPTTGDVVDGKYVLERLLGQGGMGAVYAARHRKLGHAVAIKVMLADAANHEAASRFVNEGRAAANIQNEHVVRVSDVDEENGYAYMVLELLEGEDLAQLLERERRLLPHVAVGYVMQALDGVHQAHAQGIVHRDLKPSNLFLAKRKDGSAVIKVLDFGISKAGSSSNPLGAAPGALTSTKAMLGSPLYMSPEQLRSSKSVDARADIWAIGVILYELITGKLPFMGDNLGELFAQILEVEAPLLRSHVPEAPQGLEAIIARCLQRRPEHRFQDVAELERELAAFAMPHPASAFVASAHAAGPAPPHTAMMSTPSQAQAHYPSGQYGAPPPVGPMGPPPGTYPGPPRPGMSTTGSGSNIPVVKGTVPLGASTPQPNQLAAWQSTSGSAPKPSSSMPLVIGGLAFVALIGLGLVGYTVTKGKHAGGGDGPTSASAALASADVAPPVPVATVAPVSTPAASDVAASASASASVALAATPAVPPVVTLNGKHRPPVQANGRPADPPVTPPPVTPPPATPPVVSRPLKGGVPVNER